MAHEFAERFLVIRGLGQSHGVKRLGFFQISRLFLFPRVNRRLGSKGLGRHFGHQLVSVINSEKRAVRDHADFHGVKVPFFKNLFHYLFLARLGHEKHALLRFGEHDFIRRHAGFAVRHLGHVHVHAHIAARGHFGSGAGKTGRAHVLQTYHRVFLDKFEAGLEKKFFKKRIAGLHRGTVFVGTFRDFARGETRAAKAVSSGGGAHIINRVALAFGYALHQLVAVHDAEAEHVHQRIAFVGFVKIDFAAHGGNAHAISVMGNAGHHAAHKPPDHRAFKTAETERVHEKHGPGAHGENVAQDAAHARGRALKRLDGRRVVVAFHFKHNGVAVSDVDSSRVFFARVDQHFGAALGFGVHEKPENGLGIFITAVLAPHHAEHAEFRDIRFAAQKIFDELVFFFRQPVAEHDFFGYFRFHHCRHSSRDSQIHLPSVQPSRSSEARSGCGIMPSTFPFSFMIPAILSTDPLGLASASAAPAPLT